MKNVIKEFNKRDNNINDRTNVLTVSDPVTLNDNNIQSDLFKNIKIFNKISKSADYQKLINDSSNLFYDKINEEFHNKFITEDKLDNIDILRFKIQNNYYFSKNLLLDEIDQLFINLRKKLDIQINNGTRATYKNKGRRGRRKLNGDLNNNLKNGSNINNKNNESENNNNSMIIEEEKSMSINENNTNNTNNINIKNEDNKYDIDGYIIPIQNYKYKDLYLIYLNTIYIRLIQLIQQLNFDDLFEGDIRIMINNNKLPKSNTSISSLPIKKGFDIITDYHFM